MHRVTPVHRACKGRPVQVLPDRKAKPAHRVYRVQLALPVRKAHKVCRA